MRRLVRPGDVAFDIGANIGLHSILLSKLVGPHGHLSIFEPNAELHPALSRTIAGLGNAVLHPFALSNQAGEASFFLPMNHQKASLANWTEEAIDGVPRMVRCPLRRLDDLLREGIVPRPAFIKCDVEGAERLVFEGATTLLNRRDGPILLFEANVYNARAFGFSVSDATNVLQKLALPRYAFFEIRPGGQLHPLETLNAWHSNVVAVPESRAERLTAPC